MGHLTVPLVQVENFYHLSTHLSMDTHSLAVTNGLSGVWKEKYWTIRVQEAWGRGMWMGL